MNLYFLKILPQIWFVFPQRQRFKNCLAVFLGVIICYGKSKFVLLFWKIWSYTLFFFMISVFSLFSIVTFPNQGCASQDSSARNGTCYTSSECQNKGGTSSGNCAAG